MQTDKQSRHHAVVSSRQDEETSRRGGRVWATHEGGDVKLMKASEGAGPSPAFRRYMDGKITSTEYFREVRKSANADVQRELEKPPAPAPKPAAD